MERWRERLRGLLFWRSVEDEVASEMEFHLDMEIAERIRSGMDPAEARRTAHADFGGVERYRERARQARWGSAVEILIRDLRYGLRSLRRAPGFTAAALLSLALGIGANTAVFSVVRSALLSPLPYGDADRIVRVQQSWDGTPAASISPAEYLDYVDRLESYESFGVYVYDAFEWVGDSDPSMVRGAWLSSGAMEAFGVPAARGRLFNEADVRDEASVTVVSHAFWRDQLGEGDVLGTTLTLNGREVEIIGVLPPSFRLPRNVFSAFRGHLYRPLDYTREEITMRGSHFLRGIGRLPKGMTVERAAADAADVAAWMVDTYPDDYPRDMAFAATAFPLEQEIRGRVRTPILVLMGAVGLVLLVACGNVANLLLARTDARASELALRSVLGAGKRRLAAQAMTESLVLAVIGGVLGVAFAFAATGAVEAVAPAGLDWLSGIRVDLSVLAFAVLLSLVTGVVFGWMPMTQLDARGVSQALHQSGGRVAGVRGRMHLRGLLISAELAVAVVLLSGAGLLTRSFGALVGEDPGYQTDDVTTASLALPAARYQSDDEIVAFYRDLIPSLAGIPGVTAAGAVTNLPLATSLGDLNFRIDGRPVPEGAVSPKADWQAATPGYFEAMGIRAVRGRLLEASDGAGAMGVVVINQTLARLHWPNQDPLGDRFELGGGAGPGWVTVVGVVPDVKHGGLDEVSRPQMYLAHAQFRYWGGGAAAPWMTLVVASPLDLAELRPQISARVTELDPSLPVDGFRTMAEVRASSVSLPRFLMALMLAFAGVALTLAAVGVYGLTSYAVGRRTREFGIRVALGAQPGQVTRMVVGQGARVAVAGAAVGLLGAVVAGRALSSLLYEVSPLDPVTLGAVPVLLGVVAVLATLAPARRATRADPVESLRAE